MATDSAVKKSTVTVDPYALMKEALTEMEERLVELDAELEGFDEKIALRDELRRGRITLLRVLNPDAVPKRHRRTKAEIEAEKANGAQ